MTKTIAIANQKGGVGKTTTTVNLGAALAARGSRVLVIDLDPQSSLSLWYGLEIHELKHTIYNALMQKPAEATLQSITVETADKNVFLAPSNIDLARAEPELLGEMSREYFLKNLLEASDDAYDFVLIDCPPSLGVLTTNALAAADELLVPVLPDYLSFRGADLLIRETLPKVQQRLNRRLILGGVLVNMFDQRTRHAKEVLAEIRNAYGVRVFTHIITVSTKLREASVSKSSLLQYEPRSKQSDAFRGLAEEICGHAQAH